MHDLKPIIDELKDKITSYKAITKNYKALKANLYSSIEGTKQKIVKINTQRSKTLLRYAELEARMSRLTVKNNNSTEGTQARINCELRYKDDAKESLNVTKKQK